jgi:hypothetical protein
MKAPASKLAAAPQTPVFPETLHRLRPNPRARAMSDEPNPKPLKRDNIFSKSRDTREDRAARQMKMAQSPQTFPHGR